MEFTNNRILLFNVAGGSAVSLGPQFNQGKAVVGKVFHDSNGNGVQDPGERGLAGVKVASDTGIYALTDGDGKYHFPSLETGQRLLKVEAATLPAGAGLTTDSPAHLTVTGGVLSKVSFGVRLSAPPPPGAGAAVSIAQDPVLVTPRLRVLAQLEQGKVVLRIDCNYFLFIERAELILYDKEYQEVRRINLPLPLPSTYELPFDAIAAGSPGADTAVHYQLSVFDKSGNEDRTALGELPPV